MKRDINLFYAYEIENKKPLNKGKIIALGALAAVVLLNAVVIGVLFITNYMKSQQIEELNTFFSTPVVIEKQLKFAEVERKISVAEHDIKLIQSLKLSLANTPSFKTNMYHIIYSVKPNNVDFVAFSYENSRINISCTTSDNLPPADFTKALESTGAFSSVIYRGFSEGSENTVVFPIECTLKDGIYE